MPLFNHDELKQAGDILIIDDNFENLQVLKNVLESVGYRVRPASSGELALRSISVKLPALILLDIRMPEMDGFEVCQRLKSNELTNKIPIIFISASSDTLDKVQGFELGAVDYVTKPFNPQEILMRVATHLSLAVQWQKLQEAELRYRMVANFTYDWETWQSPSGAWLYCSPSCERVTGYEASYFMNKKDFLIEITHPNDKESLREHFQLQENSRLQYPESISFRLFRKDGQEIWIEHACLPVFDEHGIYVGQRASNRDITLHKRTEAALIYARKAAEAANIAKSTFLATMSHELRTPLNAILGFSELMGNDNTLTTKQKETLTIINRSGAHLLNMINDVLDISKIEAGRLELDNQPFDLWKLLGDIQDMVSVRAINKNLSFKLVIAPEVPQFITIDSGKLRQILINLLGNAVKFTNSGGITLQVQISEACLCFDVIDTGIGILPEKQRELFKPFTQVAENNADIEGTGLGLAISKSLTELMGGSINVNSVLGEGSTFKIQLPLKIANEQEILNDAEWLPVKGIAPNQPVWRILVIDDSSENRLLLATILSEVGFEVREGKNGAEAVQLFENWQPHLIFMDMRMPVMNGYEATAKIRRLLGGELVKIVAVTASAFVEQLDNIIRAGCDAVIHKPFHAPDIFGALTKYLGVQFTYQNTPSPVVSLIQEITPDMMQSLPTELQMQLLEATLSLDVEALSGVIAEIHEVFPVVADGLENLVTHYQFEKIVNLVKTNS